MTSLANATVEILQSQMSFYIIQYCCLSEQKKNLQRDPVLFRHFQQHISEELCHPKRFSLTLIAQIALWPLCS